MPVPFLAPNLAVRGAIAGVEDDQPAVKPTPQTVPRRTGSCAAADMGDLSPVGFATTPIPGQPQIFDGVGRGTSATHRLTER